MIQESTQEQKLSTSRNPYDLNQYEQAQKLVDELFSGEGSAPFLKIMGCIRWIMRYGTRVDLDTGTMNLTVAAFSHSDKYLEVIENYAASLMDEPSESSEESKEASETEDSSKSDSEIKSELIDKWLAGSYQTPSRKLDLMAALVDVDENDLIIEALLVALQGKEGKRP